MGLYFYKARFYDPTLSRFIQADSIVPQPGRPIAWDRYGYVQNNPIRYIDPSGYVGCDTNYLGSCQQYANSISYNQWLASPQAQLGLRFVEDWDPGDRQAFISGAKYDANAQFAAFCQFGTMIPGECGYNSPEELYRATHGTTILTMSTSSSVNFCQRNANSGQEGIICFANAKGKIDEILAVHELAHVFNALIANNRQQTPYNDLAIERANNAGFPSIGEEISIGFNKNRAKENGEDYANMHSMYVFDVYPNSLGGQNRRDFMVTNMVLWVGLSLIGK